MSVTKEKPPEYHRGFRAGWDQALASIAACHGDVTAKRSWDLAIGSDGIVRLNVDGECIARIKMEDGCAVLMRNDLNAADTRHPDVGGWPGAGAFTYKRKLT